MTSSYGCGQSGKARDRHNQVKMHSQTHTEEKFGCHNSDMTQTEIPDMGIHLHSNHRSEDKCCSTCGRKSNSSKGHKTHMTIQPAGGIPECLRCGNGARKDSSKENPSTTHRVSDTLRCKDRGETFKKRETLANNLIGAHQDSPLVEKKV